MKPTKRLGFHFMRSYFDVLNKLENEKDKLSFLLSIINKQFMDQDPEELNFLVSLCYESQRHAIEKSVKGWKTANKTDLQGNPTPPKGSPHPLPKGSPPKEEEVQEEGKGEGKVEYTLYTDAQFLIDWNEQRTLILNKPSNRNRIGHFESVANFKELQKIYTQTDFIKAMKGLFNQQIMPKGNEVMRTDPKHLLANFENYLTAFEEKNDMLYGEKPKKIIV